MASTDPQKVIVIGAGPVGALAALYAATRGDNVEIYELRGDLRDASTVPLNFTRSINLAVSERGINALRHAGLGDDFYKSIIDETIPMYGRMIHGAKNGSIFSKSQAYDVHGRAIYAADRAGLNKRLLDVLEAMPNVTFYFNHKLTGADLKNKKAWFEQRLGEPSGPASRHPEVEVSFDLLIGADGAHSAARYHLMKYARVTYAQEYIDTEWCEFHIAPVTMSSGTSTSNAPPETPSTFALSPNHLHIWPGTEHMFIAIPSADKSFTCTLFAPHSTFTRLVANPSLLQSFFETNFPGVSPDLISSSDLSAQFTSNPQLPLISITCTPYHFEDAAVILGDAAHAMVPFYGQGMNAGLEDVRILFSFLDSHGVYASPSKSVSRARSSALDAYTLHRSPDAKTINTLALKNYLEMRSGVVSPVYLFRKHVEELLSLWAPRLGWRTQYARVSFSNERYSELVRDVRRQGYWLLVLVVMLAAGGSGIVAWVLRKRLGSLTFGKDQGRRFRGWIGGLRGLLGYREG